MDVLKYAVLGLGAGGAYGLTGLGVVLVYRGSGVVNFAQGAIGMVGAYLFYLSRQHGWPTAASWAMALVASVVIGSVIHLLVMRPLRSAPAISRLVATLGVLVVLLGLGQYEWGTGNARIVASILPTGSVNFGGGIQIGTGRLVIFGIAVLLTTLLSLVYRRTQFGLTTSAVAENRLASSALGISADVIGIANWVLGSVLATFAAILIVNLSTLEVEKLVLLVIPALAAALLGGFSSFWLTLGGGVLVGVIESEAAWLSTKYSGNGWGDAAPFLVIIIVLVVRGRGLPIRGERVERVAGLGSGRARPVVLVPVCAVAILLMAFVFSPTMLSALEMTFAMGLIALSVVVVSGYAGQLSLAQMALAGIGAWMASRLVAADGLPFWLGALIGVAGAVPIGILVGLPALRTRGVNLAVVTLGLAVVVESLILSSTSLTGGYVGTTVGAPSIFGIDMDTFAHPARYAVFCFVVFLGAALMVGNLRRGRAGRSLVAIRSNERAAASLGISLARAKLSAFALGSALAAAGGILLAFREPTVIFLPTFESFQSVLAVVFSVIGGIGYLVGALVGAAYAPSSFLPTGISRIFVGSEFSRFISRTDVGEMILGVSVLLVLWKFPSGLASQTLPWPLRKFQERPGHPSRSFPHMETVPSKFARPAARAATLTIRDLSVTFGGVTALDRVNVTLRPAHVHGVIGPNGAGKTTLIDAITGFVNPAQGRIELDDEEITHRSVARRAQLGIARSFQGLDLFESMTVRENLLAAGDRRDLWAIVTNLLRPGRQMLTPAAAAAVEAFHLGEVLDSRPTDLPYGQRRLVAIARAVATGAPVLLLDEPAAGLGAGEADDLCAAIRRLADDWGLSMLLVEHNVELVLQACDEVTVLDFGHIIGHGTPEEIRNDPAVVRAYLGDDHPGPWSPQSRTTASVPGTAPLIEARGLDAGYRDTPVVRRIDIEVHRGEIVALLGPNGAGKSTTLLTLAGEIPAMSGSVRRNGLALEGGLHQRARQGMAFVPEERSVFMQLTAEENLRVGRTELGAVEALFPELGALRNRRAGLLSGGEQQMLTLARALARRPSLLLADELSLGLAPLVVERLLNAIRTAADDGLGVLLVEQQVSRALQIADRVYVLRQGEIVFDGPPAVIAEDRRVLEDAYLSGLGTVGGRG